jgi:hypothetical protein
MSISTARLAIILFPILVPALRSAPAHNPLPTTSVVIDLAEQQEGTTLVRPLAVRDEATVSVRIINSIPRGIYDVVIQIDQVGMAPITLDRGTTAAMRDGASALSNYYGTALGRLDTVRDERSLPALRGEIESQLSIVGGNGVLLDSLSRLTTYQVPGPVTVRPGERLLVLVRRKSIDGERERTWTSIFTTGARGRWLVSLGFGLPILLNREREYFTVRDTADDFIIHKKDGDQSIKVVPALFFHWLPRGGEQSELSWSLMGGLGFDMRNAVVFLGLSVTYNENITIALGGVAHRLRQLNGRYSEGGRIREDLDEDQLHEEVYRINPFIGLSFRFSENLLAAE